MFPYLPIAAILAIALMAAARIIALYRRGVKPVVNDPQRSLAEKIFEASTMFLLVFWVYLIVDYADGHGPRWLPAWLDRVLIDEPPLQWFGAVLLAASVALYALALRAMGDSWRMGIDRPAHNPHTAAPAATLITHGVFARSRNPIYFGFDLLFAGAFLTHGRFILLITSVALVLVLHAQIHREERFLTTAYGERFREYRRRTRRYL
jgi:protein-S-isoprenylcysteine O-methyltransferase Ste14